MSTYSLNFKELSKVMGTRGNRDLDNNSISVRGTLEPVARDEANVEVEKDETVLTYLEGDPIPTFYRAGGKRHSKGGTPLNLPPDSFVFSDTSSMKLSGEVLKDFGFNPKKKYTPAELSYQYDINKYRKTLVDPLSDEIDRLTAELMISNNINKLGKLALLQESKKGFPQGIPVVAMPYVMTAGLDPSMFIPSEYTQDGLPMARKGGIIPKALTGITTSGGGGRSSGYLLEFNRGKFAKDNFRRVAPIVADTTLGVMDTFTNLNNQAQTARVEEDYLNQFSSGDNIYGPLAEKKDMGDYMVYSPYMLRPNEYTPVQFPGNLDPGMGIAKQGGALRRVRVLPKAQEGEQRKSLEPKLDNNNLQPTKKVRVTPGFGSMEKEINFSVNQPVIYRTYKEAIDSGDINTIDQAMEKLQKNFDEGYMMDPPWLGTTIAGIGPWTESDKIQDMISILNEKKQQLIGSREANKTKSLNEAYTIKEKDVQYSLANIFNNKDVYDKLNETQKTKINKIYKDISEANKTLAGSKDAERIANIIKSYPTLPIGYNFTTDPVIRTLFPSVVEKLKTGYLQKPIYQPKYRTTLDEAYNFLNQLIPTLDFENKKSTQTTKPSSSEKSKIFKGVPADEKIRIIID
jgi:hypothetical protein